MPSVETAALIWGALAADFALLLTSLLRRYRVRFHDLWAWFSQLRKQKARSQLALIGIGGSIVLAAVVFIAEALSGNIGTTTALLLSVGAALVLLAFTVVATYLQIGLATQSLKRQDEEIQVLRSVDDALHARPSRRPQPAESPPELRENPPGGD